MSASDWPDPRSQIVAGRQPRGAPLQPAGKATDCCSWMAIVWAKGSMARYKRLLSGQKCAVVNDRHGGAFRPGSIGNRSVVSLTAFLLKLGSKSPALLPTAEV
jgi:hypothetical protein